MNAIQKLVFTAGQKAHESLFGAKLTIPGFRADVPCTHSSIMTDFDLVPGGLSPKTYISTVCFRRDELPEGSIPSKGIKCSLDMGNGTSVLALQFWNGGLMTDGMTYKFMVTDANYHA